MAALGRLDSIVFTAGIGERASNVRAMVLKGLENFGIIIDEEKNLSIDNEAVDNFDIVEED